MEKVFVHELLVPKESEAEFLDCGQAAVHQRHNDAEQDRQDQEREAPGQSAEKQILKLDALLLRIGHLGDADLRT